MQTLIVQRGLTSPPLLQTSLFCYQRHVGINGKEAVEGFRVAATPIFSRQQTRLNWSTTSKRLFLGLPST